MRFNMPLVRIVKLLIVFAIAMTLLSWIFTAL